MKILNLLKGFIRGKLRGTHKFLLSNFAIARKYLKKSDAAGGNSRYCYRIWMNHLRNWHTLNDNCPEVVVEIGPGNSLGVGLAALISGSNKLYALERTQFWNIETNIRVFDELVSIFNQEIKSDESDIQIISALDEDRLHEIRKELSNPFDANNMHVRSIIPWESSKDIADNSVDYVFSHTVLQHVDDLPYAYRAMNKWLKIGGCISHKVDFKSMNTTKLWNGHWTLNEMEWKMVTGGTNLINRAALSTHLKLITDNGFEISIDEKDVLENTLNKKDLSDEFKHLNDIDLTTSGYYYFAQLKSKKALN